MWGDLGLPVKEFLKVMMTEEVRVLEKRRIKDSSRVQKYIFFLCSCMFAGKIQWVW